MACDHIKMQLQIEINNLKKERIPYNDFLSDITNAKEALTNYARFLRGLGEQLREVRLTGQPLDGGTCIAIASRLDGLVSGSLTEMESTAEDAIFQINGEIRALEKAKLYDTLCSDCRERQAEKTETSSSSSSGSSSAGIRAGVTPVSSISRQSIY